MALPSLAGVGNKKKLQIHPAGLLIILLSFGASKPVSLPVGYAMALGSLWRRPPKS